MGNFHCIESGCAEVRYQPYKKKGGIHYRYPEGDWITVDGDDYKIDDKRFGQCPDAVYYVKFYYHYTGQTGGCYENANGTCTYYSNGSVRKGAKVGRIDINDPELEEKAPSWWDEEKSGKWSKKITGAYIYWNYPGGEISQNYVSFVKSSGGGGAIPSSVEWEISRNDGQKDDCGQCTLQIFKEGQLIKEIENKDCPEVKELKDECELSDRTKVIQIKKLPFLERVDVVPWAYQNLGANVNRRDIPDNCLNIYKPTTATIPPAPGPIPTPSNSAIDRDFSYGFVTQICSAFGCPPPEYEVICNCSGEECPNGTCPVECGNVVCCYDPNTGISVDSIKIENYSGGHLL